MTQVMGIAQTIKRRPRRGVRNSTLRLIVLNFLRPFGASLCLATNYPRLTPWATFYRPSRGCSYTQRAGSDFKGCGQASGQFSVHFDGHFHFLARRPRLNARGERMMDLLHAEMCAEIKLRRICENLQRAEVADRDDVEEPIVDERVGRDFHPSAKIPGIGNAEIGYRETAFGMVVELNRNGRPWGREGRLQRGDGERNTATQASRANGREPGRAALLHALDHFRAHTEGSDSQEIPGLNIALMIYVRDAPDIHQPRARHTQSPCGSSRP